MPLAPATTISSPRSLFDTPIDPSDHTLTLPTPTAPPTHIITCSQTEIFKPKTFHDFKLFRATKHPLVAYPVLLSHLNLPHIGRRPLNPNGLLLCHWNFKPCYPTIHGFYDPGLCTTMWFATSGFLK
jgi:hypothetical protein